MARRRKCRTRKNPAADTYRAGAESGRLDSCFHPPAEAIVFSPTRATNIVFLPTERLCISLILYRVFTHLDSCFHTPFIVFSPTARSRKALILRRLLSYFRPVTQILTHNNTSEGATSPRQSGRPQAVGFSFSPDLAPYHHARMVKHARHARPTGYAWLRAASRSLRDPLTQSARGDDRRVSGRGTSIFFAHASGGSNKEQKGIDGKSTCRHDALCLKPKRPLQFARLSASAFPPV